jgi:hypothetical protein
MNPSEGELISGLRIVFLKHPSLGPGEIAEICDFLGIAGTCLKAREPAQIAGSSPAMTARTNVITGLDQA